MAHNTREPGRRAASFLPSVPGSGRLRCRLGLLAAAASVLLASACGQATDQLALSPVPLPLHQAAQKAGGSHAVGHAVGRKHGKAGPASPAGSSPDASAASGVRGGALFGGTAQLATQEPKLGRKLAIVRVYYLIGQTFHNPKILSQGSTLLVSLDSSGASYTSIAAGHEDRAILSFMRAVNSAAYKYHLGAIYFSFEHEPENRWHLGLGSGAQFVAAWDHVHRLAASAHLDWNDGGRLHWVLIMMHQSYAAGGAAGRYWPGSSEVDVVAADGYNSYACKMARAHLPLTTVGVEAVTPASDFSPVLGFARAHGGLPVFVAEWGSDSTPAGIQATFIREMASYVAANPAIAGALYWDLAGVHHHGAGCSYIVDNHPASLAALAAMGHSPGMQGTVTPA